jgi:hypothetical protein
MKVYILLQQFQYEGDEICACYASQVKAQAESERWNAIAQKEMVELELDKPLCRYRVIEKEIIP